MKVISSKRCVIGEAPIWNEKENLLYFTNAVQKELCKLNLLSGKLQVEKLDNACYAFCFDKNNNLIVSREDGVFILNGDRSVSPLYDIEKYKIINANDMKVGPDGNIYVGTISGLKKGVSKELDGKLYCIKKDRTVHVLLDNLCVSNGLDWSNDNRRFYHTDSVTGLIKEYSFDIDTGKICYTGRKVYLPGVDGFTINKDDNLVVTRWDDKEVCFVDTFSMTVVDRINVPNANPVSCCFAGKKMQSLIIVTANYDTDIKENFNAGYTFIHTAKVGGRKPFLFG